MEATMAIWLTLTTVSTLFFVFKLAQMENKKTETKNKIELEKLKIKKYEALGYFAKEANLDN
jgi:hypothetical protein